METKLAASVLSGILLVGAVGIALVRGKIRRGYSLPIGFLSIFAGFLAAMPSVLIKLRLIPQEAVTVALAVAYFIVFISGVAIINSQRKR